MSGADLSNLVNEAALFAVRQGDSEIHMRHFEQARDRVLMGQERESTVLSDREKELTAYHEAGHAICAAVLPHTDPVHKVTIIPRGMALGVTQQLPAEERHSYGQDYLEESIVVAMGGRIAEKLVFDVLSTGAANDLVVSTERARKMVREWGMSERIGPMAWGSQGQVFLGEDLMHTRDYSDDTARVIDEEVERILREAEEACTERAHREPQGPRPRGPGAARVRDHRRQRGDPPHPARPRRLRRRWSTGARRSASARLPRCRTAPTCPGSPCPSTASSATTGADRPVRGCRAAPRPRHPRAPRPRRRARPGPGPCAPAGTIPPGRGRPGGSRPPNPGRSSALTARSATR